MAFRLKPGEPLSKALKRIVGRQLELAATELKEVGTPKSDEKIHDARRRVKKIRAVVRLVRPSLGRTVRAVDRRLREMSRLLAPVADGQGVVQALDRLGEKYPGDLPEPVRAPIRAGLLERAARTDRKVKVDHVLQTVAFSLRAERERVVGWRLKRGGFRAIAPGLEKSFRSGRKAMRRVLTHPTPDNYHRWRRRLKHQWFHVRLLEARCGRKLIRYGRRLEALDACLGEYHDFALLRSILFGDAFVSRQETARRLRMIERYQSELRERARKMGRRIYAERPGHFVRRVRALWRLAKAAERVPK